MPRLMGSQLATAAAGWRRRLPPVHPAGRRTTRPAHRNTHAPPPSDALPQHVDACLRGSSPAQPPPPAPAAASERSVWGGGGGSTAHALTSAAALPRGGHSPPPTHVVVTLPPPATSTALADAIHTVIHPSLPATDPGHDGHGPQEEGTAGGGEVADCKTSLTSSSNCSPPLASAPPPAFRPTNVHPIRPVTEAASHQHGSRRPRRRPSAGRRVPNLRPRGYCEGTRRSGGRKGGAGGSGALRALTVRAGACYPATPHHPLNPPMAGWWGAAPQPTQHQCPAEPVITSTRRQCRVAGGWWRQRRRCGGGCGRRRATCGGRRTAPPPRTPAPGEAPPPRALHHVDEARVLALQSHERAGLRTCKNR